VAHGVNNSRDLGPVIPWLSDAQAEYFLRLGLVERIDDDIPTDPQHGDVQRINECIDAINRLNVPPGCGAPTAREALRAEGHRFGNDTIAAAVKLRRKGVPAGTVRGG
jgi:hypothetical protein